MDRQKWSKFMLFMENHYPGQSFTPLQYAGFYELFEAGYQWGARDKEKLPIDIEEEQTKPRFLNYRKVRAGYE